MMQRLKQLFAPPPRHRAAGFLAPGTWSATATAGLEEDARRDLLASFLAPTHGRLEAVGQLHQRALESDPRMYAPLARWYQQHGVVRDHHELFVAHLMAASARDYRVHATILLQTLRPYQVARVVRYTKETLRYTTRALKTAVRVYLQRRERHPAWMEECILRDRRSLKYLYSTLRIRPNEAVEAALFQDRRPVGSRLWAARQLQRLENDPKAQARLIREHTIQFSTAAGAVRTYTPEVLTALVSVMTPQQLLNNLKALERRGALGVSGMRQLISNKLRHGVRESRVHDLKALVALSQIQADEQLANEILAMTGERLRQRGRITMSTAILVDKSGSMEECIKIGKLVATMASCVADGPLYVEAFDSVSHTVRPSGTDTGFAAWNRAFEGIVASGATSLGAPLRKLKDRPIEQILMISDGEENTSPRFSDELKAREASLGRRIPVLFLRVNRSQNPTVFERDLQEMGAEHETVHFTGDYYNLPNLIPRLCAEDNFSMLSEVLSTPLYTWADLERLPPGYDEASCEIL